jgi:hypothetical protein
MFASHVRQQERKRPHRAIPAYVLTSHGTWRRASGKKTLRCGAHDTQLQRTVNRHRVRAVSAALVLCARGAHDTSAHCR